MDETRVLVTGAASGIGAALVRRIAAPGRAILLHTRKNADGLARIAAEAEAKGARTATLLADLADPEAAAGLAGAAREKLGGLDWLVANAGFADKRSFADLPEDAVASSLGPITDSFFRLAKANLSMISASPRGRVVAVSSFVAHRFPFQGDRFPASAAAKAGLEALSKALAAELAPTGATVNCVVPGYTRKEAGAHAAITPERWREISAHIPLGRLGEPDEVAAAIAFLLSDDAAYITGQSLHVSGGILLG